MYAYWFAGSQVSLIHTIENLIHLKIQSIKCVYVQNLQYLLDNNSKNKAINNLLRTTVIHLLPSMNPDGFEMSAPQPCPNDGMQSLGSR